MGRLKLLVKTAVLHIRHLVKSERRLWDICHLEKVEPLFLNGSSRKGDQVAAHGFYLASKGLNFVQLVLRKSSFCGGVTFKNILQNYVSNGL